LRVAADADTVAETLIVTLAVAVIVIVLVLVLFDDHLLATAHHLEAGLQANSSIWVPSVEKDNFWHDEFGRLLTAAELMELLELGVEHAGIKAVERIA